MSALDTRIRRYLSWGLALGLIAANAGLASAQRPAERSFRSSWDCREVALAVPVDVANVDPYVPDEFSIHQAGGKTVLAVFTQDCLVAVETGPANETVVSGVFVFVADPEGSNDPHAFDFHWGTDDKTYFKALNRLGVGDFTPGSTYESTAMIPGTLAITSDVQWKESPFTVTAQTVSPTAERVPFTSVHWMSGRHGLVRGTFPHQITARPVQGTITTTPGTVLADIIAAEQTTAAGIYFEFTIEDGITEVVP